MSAPTFKNRTTTTEVGSSVALDVNVVGGDITIDNAEINVELSAADGDNLYLANSSGTEIATNANPLRVDPTGSTTQPVSDAGSSLTVDGTVAATQSGTWNINNVSGTVSLPTGASTLAEQQTQTASLGVL